MPLSYLKSSSLLLITHFICQVSKPLVGENHPSQVRADVTVNLSVRSDIKAEWEGKFQYLVKHHVIKVKVIIGFYPTAKHFIDDLYIFPFDL